VNTSANSINIDQSVDPNNDCGVFLNWCRVGSTRQFWLEAFIMYNTVHAADSGSKFGVNTAADVGGAVITSFYESGGNASILDFFGINAYFGGQFPLTTPILAAHGMSTLPLYSAEFSDQSMQWSNPWPQDDADRVNNLFAGINCISYYLISANIAPYTHQFTFYADILPGGYPNDDWNIGIEGLGIWGEQISTFGRANPMLVTYATASELLGAGHVTDATQYEDVYFLYHWARTVRPANVSIIYLVYWGTKYNIYSMPMLVELINPGSTITVYDTYGNVQPYSLHNSTFINVTIHFTQTYIVETPVTSTTTGIKSSTTTGSATTAGSVGSTAGSTQSTAGSTSSDDSSTTSYLPILENNAPSTSNNWKNSILIVFCSFIYVKFLI